MSTVRGLSIIFILLFIISITGCGDKDIDTSETTTSETVQTTTEKETAETINEFDYSELDFGIFIIDNITDDEFSGMEIGDIALESEPVFKMDDLQVYNSISDENIEIYLNKTFNADILFGENKLLGKPFILVLEGEKKYKGQAISLLSSFLPMEVDLIISTISSLEEDRLSITSEDSLKLKEILMVLNKFDRNEESFLFPYSFNEMMQYDELQDMLFQDIDMALFEIFARKGHIFSEPEITEYFSKFKWYKPDRKITEDDMNAIEEYNIEILRFIMTQSEKHEREKSFESYEITYEKYSENKELFLDINNDGVEEKITYQSSDTNNESVISINDKTVMISMLEPDFDFYIVDIDKEDDYMEIVLHDFGPSNDDESYFFRYSENRIMNIGHVEGSCENGIEIKGDGILTSRTRVGFLHTWFYRLKYEAGGNVLRKIPQKYYDTYHRVFLNENLVLNEDRNPGAPEMTIEKNTALTLIGTDGEKWVLVETDQGDKGWFYVEDYNMIGNDRIWADEIFFGLSYAD